MVGIVSWYYICGQTVKIHTIYICGMSSCMFAVLKDRVTGVFLFLGRSKYDQYRKITYSWNVVGGDVEQTCQFNNDPEFPCECAMRLETNKCFELGQTNVIVLIMLYYVL